MKQSTTEEFDIALESAHEQAQMELDLIAWHALFPDSAETTG